MKIFIISAWSGNLTTDEKGNLYLINKDLGDLEFKGIPSGNMICEYLSGYIHGIKTCDKEEAIRLLLEAGHRVVTIEDTDFSHIIHDNHLFCKTYGFISNKHSYLIKNFIENAKDSKMITLQQAIDLATKAHEGQWRKGQWDSVSASGYAREIAKHSKQSFIARDGNHIQNETDCNVYISKPYITHPLAVMEMMSTEKEKIVAVLHNAIKDTKAELFTEYGKCYFLFNETQYRISIFEHEALQSLTKFKNESYTNYIKQISQNKLATKVKLADMFHNMSDNPSEHAKQKYLKAIPILLRNI